MKEVEGLKMKCEKSFYEIMWNKGDSSNLSGTIKVC